MESGKEATVQLHLEATPSLLEMVTHEFFILEGKYFKAYLQYSLHINPRY